jgi:hypothetical protein
MRKSAKNISKIFIATTLLSCALIPAFTLTSCATISQWTLPLKIGDINNGPFSNVTATSFGYLDPQTQQSGDFSSFLPTNYISFTDRSNSGAGNQAFAYTNPEKHGTYDPNSQTQEHYPLG